jgi:DNA-directed RNA polymerase specialized sigma24 family protein
MRSLWLEGRSSREVAEIFGCTTSWVNKVVKRKVWVNV